MMWWIFFSLAGLAQGNITFNCILDQGHGGVQPAGEVLKDTCLYMPNIEKVSLQRCDASQGWTEILTLKQCQNAFQSAKMHELPQSVPSSATPTKSIQVHGCLAYINDNHVKVFSSIENNMTAFPAANFAVDRLCKHTPPATMLYDTPPLELIQMYGIDHANLLIRREVFRVREQLYVYLPHRAECNPVQGYGDIIDVNECNQVYVAAVHANLGIGYNSSTKHIQTGAFPMNTAPRFCSVNIQQNHTLYFNKAAQAGVDNFLHFGMLCRYSLPSLASLPASASGRRRVKRELFPGSATTSRPAKRGKRS